MSRLESARALLDLLDAGELPDCDDGVEYAVADPASLADQPEHFQTESAMPALSAGSCQLPVASRSAWTLSI